jgi:ABC-2 type transport system ATP-binding protein
MNKVDSPGNNRAMVEVRGLTKSYGEFNAITDVSFSVSKGEVLGFLGPNGAGKTTTMRVITGFMPPTQGTVLVDGLDVVSNSLEVRRKIGYLPEHPPIYLEFTVLENLDFVSKLKGIPRSQRADRIEYAVRRCGLGGVEDRFAGHLSKGYRQRVGLAIAILNDPDVLILDEPTIGLDPVQIQEIRNLIRELGKDHTVILSTHILPEVVMTCDRAVIIHHGSIVADGTLDQLAKKAGGRQRITLRLAEPDDGVITRLKKIGGVGDVVAASMPKQFSVSVKDGADISNEIALEVLNAGWGLVELKDEIPSLEEVFVRLTAN